MCKLRYNNGHRYSRKLLSIRAECLHSRFIHLGSNSMKLACQAHVVL